MWPRGQGVRQVVKSSLRRGVLHTQNFLSASHITHFVTPADVLAMTGLLSTSVGLLSRLRTLHMRTHACSCRHQLCPQRNSCVCVPHARCIGMQLQCGFTGGVIQCAVPFHSCCQSPRPFTIPSQTNKSIPATWLLHLCSSPPCHARRRPSPSPPKLTSPNTSPHTHTPDCGPVLHMLLPGCCAVWGNHQMPRAEPGHQGKHQGHAQGLPPEQAGPACKGGGNGQGA